MLNCKFISTTNMETAALLTHAGFTLINQNEEKWTFLNDDRLMFERLDDVIYTDILTF